MPNDVSAGYNSGRIDLSGAPGSDLDWDSLFPNPEVQPASQPQVATTGTNPQSEPQAQQDQFYLRNADGTIAYRTAEDAIKGISHKDAEVAKYRNFLKANGIDPNSLQKTAPEPQVQTQTSHARFFDRVAEAASKGDKDAYENAMKEFIGGLIDPWRPTLTAMNQFKAYQQVSRELPGFKEFYDNGGYQQILEKNPLFKDMNQIGETDPNAATRLPELYRSAYFYYKGTTPVQTEATNSTTQNNPTVQARPTLQNSSLTPPPPTASTSGWAEPNWRGTKPLGNEARKQLIQDGNNKFQGMRFEDLGL